ncbi:MAG TPA: 5-formyltetrahydrofolate cyclo-ligase [Myxococcales bacterium]|nr:5-formyltetrahydrofolate cyclo-ligase [Myxococcales bacterium]
MVSLDQQKRDLRALARARMPKRGTPGYLTASAAAQQRLAAAAIASGARTIALYRALPSECGTESVVAALEAAGRELCYPLVVPGARPLDFRRAGAFVPGALGVEEPTGEPVALSGIDLLVVPAVVVDRRGGRIGRGRGHYDATLAGYRGQSVALVFESQLVPEVPLGDHDVRVGAVCTDARWIDCL